MFITIINNYACNPILLAFKIVRKSMPLLCFYLSKSMWISLGIHQSLHTTRATLNNNTCCTLHYNCESQKCLFYCTRIQQSIGTFYCTRVNLGFKTEVKYKFKYVLEYHTALCDYNVFRTVVKFNVKLPSYNYLCVN